VKDLIDNGGTLLQVAEADFKSYVRYKRSLEGYRQMVQEETEYEKPKVTVLWGEPGTGKSRFIYDNHKDIWAWPGKEWFDGYTGQEVALFDDFDGTDFSYRLLLRVLDRYKINVPIKGGHVAFRPKYIYITSNLRPEDWYNLKNYKALLRRIDEIKHFNYLLHQNTDLNNI
jgi:hypothetical protein